LQKNIFENCKIAYMPTQNRTQMPINKGK